MDGYIEVAFIKRGKKATFVYDVFKDTIISCNYNEDVDEDIVADIHTWVSNNVKVIPANVKVIPAKVKVIPAKVIFK